MHKNVTWAKVPKGYVDYKRKRGKYCVCFRLGNSDVVRVLGFKFPNGNPESLQGRVAYKVIDGPGKGTVYTACYEPKDLKRIEWFKWYQSAVAKARRMTCRRAAA